MIRSHKVYNKNVINYYLLWVYLYMTCTLRIINLNRDRGFTTMEFAKKKKDK